MLTRVSKGLAAFLVLPFLLLVGVSPAAQGAPVHGPNVSAKVTLELDHEGFGIGGGRKFDCLVDAHYVVDSHGYFVGGRLACKYDSWNSAAWPGPTEGTTEVTFKGAGAATGWTVSGAPPSGSFTTSFPGPMSLSTQITQVCISGTYKRNQIWQPDQHYSASQCAALDMGAPAEPVAEAESCQYIASVGTPETETIIKDRPESSAGVRHEFRYRTTVTAAEDTRLLWYIVTDKIMSGGQAQLSSTADSLPAPYDGLYVFYGEIGRNGTAAPQLPQGASTELMHTVFPSGSFNSGAGSTDVTHRILGVGLVAFEPTTLNLSANMFRVGGQHEAALLGVTDSSRCAYYWGEKFWDDGVEGEGADEPISAVSDGSPSPGEGTPEPPVLDPVPEPEPGCEFSLSDPSSWLSGGMCSLVGLFAKALGILGQILSAIVGLPAALLEGLIGLFVPEEGFIEGKIDQVSDAFDDTTVGNYLGAVTNISVPSAAGCEGPAVTINPYGSGPGAQYPMSACDGAMASAAATSRLILGISLGLGGGLVCLRILGRSFGWDPVIGGKE